MLLFGGRYFSGCHFEFQLQGFARIARMIRVSSDQEWSDL
jgi:hypothetical protein